MGFWLIKSIFKYKAIDYILTHPVGTIIKWRYYCMSTVNIRVSFICSGLINLLTEFFVEEVENLISFWVVDLCLMLWSDVN